MLDYKADIFLHVARSLNITQTARELNFSQPAITIAIQKLEDYYRVNLFYRHKRGLKLTQAGEILFNHLQNLKDLSIRTENAMMNVQGIMHGHLEIGSSPSFGDYILPRLIGIFGESQPHITYNLRIGTNRKIYQMLREKTVEIAFFAGTPPSLKLNTQVMMEDELILIVGRKHHFRERTIIEKNELLGLSLIQRERGSESRRFVDSVVKKLGLDLKKLCINAEFTSLEAIKNAVEANLGAAMVSRCTCEKEIELKTLFPLRISGAAMKRNIYLATLDGFQLTNAAVRFLNYCSGINKMSQNS